MDLLLASSFNIDISYLFFLYFRSESSSTLAEDGQRSEVGVCVLQSQGPHQKLS